MEISFWLGLKEVIFVVFEGVLYFKFLGLVFGGVFGFIVFLVFGLEGCLCGRERYFCLVGMCSSFWCLCGGSIYRYFLRFFG